MNPFEILGISPNTNAEDIKKAWRKKCLENHPDQGGSKEDFLNIMHAYRMLTDASYAGEFSPIKSLDFQVQIAANFEEAFFGKTFVVSYNRIILDNNGKPLNHDNIEPLVLTIEIPPGTQAGSTLKFENYGMKLGNKTGSAIVRILVENHERYRYLNNLDVISEEVVTLDKMVKGGTQEVLTLYGLKTLYIPPGTFPGSKLQIKHCGVRQKGSHIVEIKPLFPTVEDLKGDQWKGLNILWDIDKKEEKDSEFFKIHDQLRK